MPIQESRINPLDLEKNISIGITLPLTGDTSYNTAHPKSGSFAHGDESVGDRFQGGEFNLSYTTVDQVKSNLKNLVLTNQGERLMHPTFGCGVQGLLFENITSEILNNLKTTINAQVEIWLPYLTVTNIDFGEGREDENKLFLRIDYNIYDNTLDPQSIVLEF